MAINERKGMKNIERNERRENTGEKKEDILRNEDRRKKDGGIKRAKIK